MISPPARVVVALGLAVTLSQIVFRGGVDYVSVDVVVTGAGEKPITDLKAEEFEIHENGRAQRISDFRYVSIPVEHRKIDLNEVPAPPPDVVTNAPRSTNSRLFVMIIDDLNLVEMMVTPVQRVMTEFISTLSPDDEVAILFAGRSDLSQNFTRDRGRLIKTIKNVRAAWGFGVGIIPWPPNAQSISWQLKHVAEALAHSGHARRAIVFVGTYSSLNPGAPVGSRERSDAEIARADMDKAFDAARRADVPIYTLDPRGIPNEVNSTALAPSVPSRIEMAGLPERADEVASRAQIQQEHLAEIAINTGGRAFINRPDITGAIDEIVEENGSFYVLGYYPEPYVRDGKFHDISVSVKRPGAHVRARQGYVAADAAAPATTDLKSTLDAAMGAGLNVSGITLSAFASPLAPGTKGTRTAVAIEIEYPVPPSGARHIDDDVQVSLVTLDSEGTVKASTARAWHFSGTTPPTGTVKFLIDDVIDIPPQPTRLQPLTLRLGVASKSLGKAGTLQMPIDVPDFTGNRLQLSTVALALAGDTRESAMGADALKLLVPFQPTTERTFAATDTLRVFARAFWGSKEVEPTATLSLTGPALRPPQSVTLTRTPQTTGRPEATLETTFPLNGLVAGDYVLHVEAKLPNGQPARRDVVFAIK